MKRMDKNMFGISIADYLKKMLLQWKAILLVCFIFAVALSAVQYKKELKSYDEMSAMRNAEAEQNISAETQIETILSGLSADDRLAVEQLIRQGVWLHERNKYMEESLLMNLDPYDVKTISMSFHLSGIDNEMQIKGLIVDYLSAFDDADVISTIGEAIDPDIESRYIKELIMYQIFDNEKDSMDIEGNSFSIYIAVPDDVDEEAVIQAVSKIVDQKNKELSTKVEGHGIILASSSTQKMVVYQIVKKKNEVINSITNMQGLHNNAVATSSEVQLGAYTQISTLMEIAAEGGAAADDASEIQEKPGFSKKYFTVGFILGLVLYLFAALAYILTSGRVTSASSVENSAEIRSLGEFVVPKEKNNAINKLFTSRTVARILYPNVIDTAKQTDTLVRKICSICSFHKLDEVTFIDIAGEDDACREMVDIVSGTLGEKSISTEYVQIQKDMVDESLEGLENAILVISDSSKDKQLEEIMELSRFYNINTLGYVYCHEL